MAHAACDGARGALGVRRPHERTRPAMGPTCGGRRPQALLVGFAPRRVSAGHAVGARVPQEGLCT
jgi:hypothetical protein